MSEIITKEQIPEYEAFLQSHPKGHFAQSVLWAKQKPMWKWEAIVSRDQNGKIKGSLAVLIRKIVPGLLQALPSGNGGGRRGSEGYPNQGAR